MRKHRKYIKSEEVKELVERLYDENGRGTTIEDIINTFEVAKKKAQRIVKYLHVSKILFTAQDLEKEGFHIKGIKRERPQRYFSIGSKTKIIARSRNNVLKDTTGYIDPLGNQKAENFTQALALLGPLLLFIHKLQLWTTIDLDKLDLSETFRSKPLPTSFIERIGLYEVKYKFLKTVR